MYSKERVISDKGQLTITEVSTFTSDNDDLVAKHWLLVDEDMEAKHRFDSLERLVKYLVEVNY